MAAPAVRDRRARPRAPGPPEARAPRAAPVGREAYRLITRRVRLRQASSCVVCAWLVPPGSVRGTLLQQLSVLQFQKLQQSRLTSPARPRYASASSTEKGRTLDELQTSNFELRTEDLRPGTLCRSRLRQ